jgi:hypothetical protein
MRVPLLGIIVDEASADPELAKDDVVPVYNHITIAKPENWESETYKLVLDFLQCTSERHRQQNHKVVRIDGNGGRRKAA